MNGIFVGLIGGECDTRHRLPSSAKGQFS
jgi:hypothetical protein